MKAYAFFFNCFMEAYTFLLVPSISYAILEDKQGPTPFWCSNEALLLSYPIQIMPYAIKAKWFALVLTKNERIVF